MRGTHLWRQYQLPSGRGVGLALMNKKQCAFDLNSDDGLQQSQTNLMQ